ncbi:MAG: hypothetical protein SFH39_17920 [Candidatus Magnetobacterium sp. LHC-1]|uniref:Uncharacterized protein n=1 Tax=Candidatus Magnetobacterium casense TaxID=1455061 RepID=A0ABS6S1G0_9BACT|nr:hypothetical protein [Candidatus Magnetobacterium casensis]MBF0607993.1 hypothetical protein [Nitrospirota bacterium]MBV6342234.1 hypothetical protein [Candidatus Magnetobacterium casensis]
MTVESINIIASRDIRSVISEVLIPNYIPTAIVAIHGITGNVISGLYANTL